MRGQAGDPVSGMFCRKCNYDLRASTLRCGECGRPFDSADPRTFLQRPRPHLVRRLRSALFALLLMTAAYGVIVGWLAYGYYIENAVVAKLPASLIPIREPMLPAWARLGLPTRWERFDHRVVRFRDQSSAGVPFHLPELHRLSWLRNMPFTPTGNDATLQSLARCPSLREVNLSGPNVSDEVIDVLSATPLRTLGVYDSSRLTDVGYSKLARFTQLERLALGEAHLNASRLESLSRLVALRELGLIGSIEDDQQLNWLASLTNLEILQLSTDLAESGFVALAKFPQLRELAIHSTIPSEAAVGHLARLPTLRHLMLRGDAIDAAAYQRLQTLMPNVTMKFWTELP